MRKKKARRNQPEFDSQVAVIAWARGSSVKYPELNLLYSIPNGCGYSVGSRVKMYRSGVLSGIPDLCLPISTQAFKTLYIEMKAKDGTVSPNQKKIHALLIKQKHWVAICYNEDQAITVLKSYVELHRANRDKK